MTHSPQPTHQHSVKHSHVCPFPLQTSPTSQLFQQLTKRLNLRRVLPASAARKLLSRTQQLEWIRSSQTTRRQLQFRINNASTTSSQAPFRTSMGFQTSSRISNQRRQTLNFRLLSPHSHSNFLQHHSCQILFQQHLSTVKVPPWPLIHHSPGAVGLPRLKHPQNTSPSCPPLLKPKKVQSVLSHIVLFNFK